MANSLAGLPKPKNIFIISSKTQGKIKPVADDFDLSSLRGRTLCYYSLGIQDDIELAPCHFLDGFNCAIHKEHIDLCFTSHCPKYDYGTEYNIAMLPEAMFAFCLPFTKKNCRVDSTIAAIGDTNLHAVTLFTAQHIEKMVRRAIEVLAYLDLNNPTFKRVFPGVFPDGDGEEISIDEAMQRATNEFIAHI